MNSTVPQTKLRAAFASVAASAALTIAKLVAGLMSGSLALLSEAGHSLLDTAATTLTFFAIREADKPADEEHQYGHGKIEAVSALAETGLLLVLAAVVLVAAIRRLFVGEVVVEATPLAFAVLLVAIGVDLVRWRALSKLAREARSEALAADALHFSSDLVASVLVLLGLVAARFGYPQGDAVAAIGVAAFVAIAGCRLGSRTIDTLLDAAPKGMSGRIRTLVQSVPGVEAIEQLKLRPAGGQVIGELGIAVARTLPLERVGEIKEEVAAAIAAGVPEADVTVTANPKALDDETVLEKVLVVAAMRRLAVHHVTVQENAGQKCVSLDVEIDGRMRHGEAHDLASSLERAIAAEIGPDIEVETHIEPLEVRELRARDARPERRDAITRSLTRRASESGRLSDIHSVRVRETPAGLIVNYHCRVDPNLSVDDVHEEVDGLDRKVKADDPAITRIVGHAEPLPASGQPSPASRAARPGANT
jgi:cation diffusion facilitator family transporter